MPVTGSRCGQRRADVDAALDYAGELTERTSKGNAYWLGIGPTNTTFRRMSVASDKDYDQTVTTARA